MCFLYPAAKEKKSAHKRKHLKNQILSFRRALLKPLHPLPPHQCSPQLSSVMPAIAKKT
jgi:hypothetical protein